MKFIKVNNFRHAWMALYFVIYILWFILDEHFVTGSYTSIHIRLDDFIPFCEYFVVFYVLWYPLMAFTGLYFMFRDADDFCRYIWSLAIGMSFCLAFYVAFPNGQDLRPHSFSHNNFFTWLVGSLYSADTNLNVFPSMHVFGTIAPTVALLKNKETGRSKSVRAIFILLSILICLSTVFIKQHSVLDLIGGAALYVPVYWLVYKQGRHWKLWTWPARPIDKGKGNAKTKPAPN